MLSFILFLFDRLVPRFITEDVALELRDDGYHIVCCMADVREGERFDAVASIRSFTWLGTGFAPKMIGEARPWQ